MKRWVWIVMTVWLFIPSVCMAGWYKYKDANGVWHYTDSMTSDVSPEKRVKGQKVKEPDDYLTEEQKQERHLQETRAKEAEAEAAAEKAKQERIQQQYKNISTYESLEQKRKELADLYKRMMDQKRNLEAQKEKVDTAEAYQAHQNKVAEFNKSAADYKARRQAYEAAVKAFEAKSGKQDEK